MGSLKPGVQYIYERYDGTVYAREFGADPSTRIVIGYDWELDDNPARVKGARKESVIENKLWYDIRQAAKTDPALHEACERVKLLYYLSKEKCQNPSA